MAWYKSSSFKGRFIPSTRQPPRQETLPGMFFFASSSPRTVRSNQSSTYLDRLYSSKAQSLRCNSIDISPPWSATCLSKSKR